MEIPRKLRNLIFGLRLDAMTAALAIAFLLIVAGSQPAQAQTFNVLHAFTGGGDGANPDAGVTLRGGNLYGTAAYGGYTGGNCSPRGCGTVYKITNNNGNWIFAPLYKFAGGNDGDNPAGLVFGSNGTIYGTTNGGGAGGGGGCNLLGCGTVFNLRPSQRAPRSVLEPWTETVLYRFQGAPDGSAPENGNLVFDQTGNLYGTTYEGGANLVGTTFELSPSQGGWSESVLYSFGAGGGIGSYSGVIFDGAGNLYGTLYDGGPYNYGVVYQLTPSGPPWTEHFVYAFEHGSDGGFPWGGLIFDQSGNLYGTTTDGGQGGGGTVFELSPSSGGWTFTLLYGFTGGPQCGPFASLAMDAAGNLYGTTYCDGVNGSGNVFKLTHSGGSWTYTDLYDFTGGNDGANPTSNVIYDSSGNLYGTASNGGGPGHSGVVWMITP